MKLAYRVFLLLAVLCCAFLVFVDVLVKSDVWDMLIHLSLGCFAASEYLDSHKEKK